jgi:hypothetical protein
MELIDCEVMGNAIRLYFGKNGEQWGDDWGDYPYEHNASIVNEKYVEGIVDMLVDCDYDVLQPEDIGANSNSMYARKDFIIKAIFAFVVQSTIDGTVGEKVYFGDTPADIVRKAKGVCVHVKKMDL